MEGHEHKPETMFQNGLLVVHPANDLNIWNASDFKTVRSLGPCGGPEMIEHLRKLSAR
jgi:hypothetical protein